MVEIPKAQDSGAFGSQAANDKPTQAIEATPPTYGLTLSKTVEGLAATRPRRLGGEVPAAFLAAALSQLERDNDALHDKLDSRDREICQLQAELTAEKIAAARLKGARDSTRKANRLRNFGIFAGAALISAAIDLYKSSFFPIAILVATLGVVLLVISWWTATDGAAND